MDVLIVRKLRLGVRPEERSGVVGKLTCNDRFEMQLLAQQDVFWIRWLVKKVKLPVK